MRTRTFTQIALASAFVFGMQVTNAQDAATLPTSAAPTPTQAAEDVLPIFTDHYPNAVGVTFQEATGGENCVKSIINFTEGDEMLSVTDLNGGAGGLDFNSAVDVTEYDSLHFDVYLLKNAIENIQILFDSVWSSTIPGITASNVDDYMAKVTPNENHPKLDNLQTRAFWFRRDGGGVRSFFVDNIYFYKAHVDEPGSGINTLAAQDLISVSTQGNVVTLSSDVTMTAVQVYTLAGQHVMTLQGLGYSAVVNLEAEQAGLYLFQITLNNGEATTKKILNM